MARDAVAEGAGAPGDQDGRAGKRSHERFLPNCRFQGQRFVLVQHRFNDPDDNLDVLRVSLQSIPA
jgi:hypothetical protein